MLNISIIFLEHLIMILTSFIYFSAIIVCTQSEFPAHRSKTGYFASV